MQQYRVLLFIIVFTTDSSEIFGQQYEWSGNYQWSDDECNQTQCCCPHGLLSVISNDTSIGFISNLRGQTDSDERKQSVLFELKIDKEKTRKVYANTQHLSSVPDENETLFTVGTIFHKYGDVQYDKVQHVSIVQLQLISDKEAQDFCSGGYFTSEYDRIGNATSIYAQFIKVGYLLQKYTKNNFDSVKKYYTLLYQLSPLICHAGLGYVTSKTQELDLAWAHQDEALQIYKSSKGLHDSLNIEFLIYDCLGRSFRTRKMWNLALECYMNIARVGFDFFLLDRSATLHRYFNIAQ
ncbi:unnamed protein product [Rotaria sp. Silwood2]|nr:unnamed protein product [Rotaria sp. Silwood2]